MSSLSMKKKIEALQLQKDGALETMERLKEFVRDAVSMMLANGEKISTLKKRLSYLEMVYTSAVDTLTKATAKLEEKKKLLIATRKEKVKLEAIVLERAIRRQQEEIEAAKATAKTTELPQIPEVVPATNTVDDQANDEETNQRVLELEAKLNAIGNSLKTLRKKMHKQQLRMKLPSRKQKRHVMIKR